jgi:hypothetical protein
VSNLEVVEHCQTKYRDIVKYHTSLEKKRDMIVDLIKLVDTADLKASICCLQLIEGLVKD